MITLNLLHPTQSIPVQSWTFNDKSVIKIGRSRANEVIIHSAVVSRCHVEIIPGNSFWELINKGKNGIYVYEQKLDRIIVTDGIIIRLSNSGPRIQIQINSAESKARFKIAPRKSTLSSQEEKQLKDTFIT
ncbi:MAG: FHA domain-containing protein [Xenococcaceae cyanobacterium]